MKKRRLLSIVISLCMVLALMPQMVFAEGETSSTPSVSAYATKDQLTGDTFAPDSDGTANHIGKIVFGKNSSGNAQEWYILGKDTGVTGDNTIIFAASPIATNQVFNSDRNYKPYNYEAGTGYGDSAGSTEVYSSHYGASDLRKALQSMVTNADYFTESEQGLMNATTVTTNDLKNNVDYTTTDKLYALAADGSGYSYKTIKAGSGDSTVLAHSHYWASGDQFWLRSYYSTNATLVGYPEVHCVAAFGYVDVKRAVQPASNLKLSSVLFASAATAASSDTAESETIADGTAMTLRLDGTNKDIGTVKYSATTGDIKAVKGSTSQTAALIVQGNDGTNDWYYSKKIDTSETVNASAIKSVLSLSLDIDLSDCKIWLEITDTDGLIYAVGSAETTITDVTSVDITGIDTPKANTTLDTEASCATTGVSSTTPQITWTPDDTTAGYNTSYTASITLTADTFYAFTNTVTATVNGKTARSVNKNADGTLTVTYTFPEIPDTVDPVISGVEDGKTYCSAQTVTVSDNDAIATVTVNGTEVNLDANNQFTLPANGEQTIVATDKAGNKKTVTVTVNNGHTAGVDDGDCSTPVYCIYHPNEIAIVAKTHDFSGEWDKDDTGHWHKCQNPGCDQTDTKIDHSGTDDGDCTTAVTCECGYTVTAANAKHTYGEWQSNGDGTHTRKCTIHGCDGFENDNCAGGEATCTAKAECEHCGAEYGELDSSNHDLVNTPAKDATVTETGNKEYWQCKDCQKYFSDEEGTDEITLDDTVISKLPPEIIKGKGQSITAGEKKALSFTSNAAFDDFKSVTLDGDTLDTEYYTAESGSIIVTLDADYVATLPVGEHTIGIVSESGTAETTFTVAKKAASETTDDSDKDSKSDNEDSVKTGDNTNLDLWLALMLLSGAGITGVTAYTRRKRTNE